MLTLEGTEIRYDGEIVGYLIANRGMQMTVKDLLDEMQTPLACDHCEHDATICVDCADAR
jgi:hypothetical protein